MLVGLGGGAASSITSGEGTVDLDFASVQRGNAEVQRRAQEVINACTAMGVNNPIKFIHDVGAGGLSNALPELVHDAGLGARFELREIDNADRSMSPLQIWCCEAQERYVMAVSEAGLPTFKGVAKRERCGYSVVGQATGQEEEEKRLILLDRDSKDYPKPIDLPMSVLFGKPPKMSKVVESTRLDLPAFDNTFLTFLPKASTRATRRSHQQSTSTACRRLQVFSNHNWGQDRWWPHSPRSDGWALASASSRRFCHRKISHARHEDW